MSLPLEPLDTGLGRRQADEELGHKIMADQALIRWAAFNVPR